MTAINLLPWRELKREREKKQFLSYLTIGAFIAAMIIFFMDLYAQHLIKIQQARNKLLDEQITLLDRQVKSIADIKKLRQELVARMQIIQNLQTRRGLVVHLLDELVKIMPDDAYLVSIERIDSHVTVLGFAASNASISQIMRKIQNNPWIQDPQLSEIKKANDDNNNLENQFKLNFSLTKKTRD
ncbi:MAG: PilN domain-containing protein [Legionella sp.]